jgi:hypothetical protein
MILTFNCNAIGGLGVIWDGDRGGRNAVEPEFKALRPTAAADRDAMKPEIQGVLAP